MIVSYQNVHGYINFIVLLKLKTSHATFLKAVRKARDSAVFLKRACYE